MIDKDLIVRRLRYFYGSNKRMPTYGEMCGLLGYRSKGAVRYLVQKLVEEELIAKDDKGKLFPKKLLSIPLLGVIKAGYPMQAEIIEDNYLNLHVLFETMSRASFALVVSGDSMNEAGILDGDTVIIDKYRQVKKGDVVAACFDGEWTVKYFENQQGKTCLVPANKNYPVLYPKINLEIGGVVINVLRNYK